MGLQPAKPPHPTGGCALAGWGLSPISLQIRGAPGEARGEVASPCPHRDAERGGGRGARPGPCTPGGSQRRVAGRWAGAASPCPGATGAAARGRQVSAPARWHGGARGGGRREGGTGAVLPVLPGLRASGSAPGRTHHTEHAGSGASCPGGCEVKWVGTSKPASRGGSNERKPRGTPRPCLSFPTLNTYPLKAPGAAGGCDPVCPLPHTHPTATATAASCWNGGPDGVGAIRPIPPTP